MCIRDRYTLIWAGTGFFLLLKYNKNDEKGIATPLLKKMSVLLAYLLQQIVIRLFLEIMHVPLIPTEKLRMLSHGDLHLAVENTLV